MCKGQGSIVNARFMSGELCMLAVQASRDSSGRHPRHGYGNHHDPVLHLFVPPTNANSPPPAIRPTPTQLDRSAIPQLPVHLIVLFGPIVSRSCLPIMPRFTRPLTNVPRIPYPTPVFPSPTPTQPAHLFTNPSPIQFPRFAQPVRTRSAPPNYHSLPLVLWPRCSVHFTGIPPSPP